MSILSIVGRAFALAALLVIWHGMASAGATQVAEFLPQGVVGTVHRVQVRFVQPAIALGDPHTADPFLVNCQPHQSGEGRWIDPRHWEYRFDAPLGGAVRCVARVNPAFADVQGGLLDYPDQAFETGGPRANLYWPWGTTIAEDQGFVLRFNTQIQDESLLARTHCQIQGLGEAVPVRMVRNVDRERLLDALDWEGNAPWRDNARVIQCKRLLPSGAKVDLVVEPGVLAAAQPGLAPAASVASLVQSFEVRDPFHAALNCTRTHAQAPCSPLNSLTLSFSSPISRAQAERVRLQVNDETRLADAFSTSAAPSDGWLDELRFSPPFPENISAQLILPEGLQDDMGRPLANAARFPLDIPLDTLPPLVKFSSGAFGIVERFADGPPAQPQTPAVPLALRRAGPDLITRALAVSAGTVRDHVIRDEVQALQWLARVQALQTGQMTPGQFADRLALRSMRDDAKNEPLIDVRSRSIFQPDESVRVLQLPGLSEAEGPDIELIGLPLEEPGLHVLEVASPRLGAALLATEDDPDPMMYVRSAVLVTNLAVHLKTGRDDVLVWVTTLDQGQPVPDARVALLSCDGRLVASGQTDHEGIWHADTPVDVNQWCDGTGMLGVMASAWIPADHSFAYGQADFSFVWSTWDEGIEPWRFNIPSSQDHQPDWVAHAVLDRTLLRAGETVSMKLFLRQLIRNGLRSPVPGRLPSALTIRHVGSGETIELPVHWQKNAGQGVYALLDYPLPESARLGAYTIELTPQTAEDDYYGGPSTLEAGRFRVESFKLPLLEGSLKILSMGDEQAPLVAPGQVQVDMQLSWIGGGPAQELPVTLSAVSRPLQASFDDYQDYSFQVHNPEEPGVRRQQLRQLFFHKHDITLDAQGYARADVPAPAQAQQPQTWLFEASFPDPNGEVQTLAKSVEVWPSDVMVGIQAGRWISQGQTSIIQLVTLGTDGQPRAGVKVQVDARVRTAYSTRKRLVGGFYTYDTQVQDAPLGTLCEGKSDSQGLFRCSIQLDQSGEVTLEAHAADPTGRVSRADASLWVWGDAAWFGSDDHDRMDVIPTKKHWKPGETAEFAVRMPFRHARALVAVEREGVLQAHVVTLEGDEPVIRIPVSADWGPNVYVSVLALRGRLRSLPWSSMVDWGWRHPLDWWQAYRQQTKGVPPATGLVDLAKPSFRFGIASIQVDSDKDRIEVAVLPEQAIYRVRETARVRVRATLPDGRPAAGAGLAFAAIDEALLELQDNESWDILDRMQVLRDYGVWTFTGQSEVVGRRHYGRKAVPAGGGGGLGATRELFDTRLLWQGHQVLDANGEVVIEVPLNDSLSRFRLVAVADYAEQQFGTGHADIITTQDLQLVSGLPLLVREQDRFQASATVLNRTASPMELIVDAQVRQDDGPDAPLKPQRLSLTPGSSQRVSWTWQAPWLTGTAHDSLVQWEFSARTVADSEIQARDAIQVTQRLLPAIPLTVQQATLAQLLPDAPIAIPVAAPAHALETNGHVRGGVRVDLQSSLAGTLPAVSDWLRRYPYTCFEQLGSRALGMQELDAWNALTKRLPAFLDDQGLVAYFPGGRGSVALTAYVLELSGKARELGWAYGIPPASRQRMMSGLADFVLGRTEASAWAPVNDDFWRKLIAMEALARWDAWEPGMWDSFDLVLDDWPTPALITWLSLLQHVPDFHDREQRLAQVQSLLRARLVRHGTTLQVADESAAAGWWLMNDPTTAQARLLWAVLDLPSWRADWPLLAQGLLAMQTRGAWSTTTANALGVTSINRFAALVETRTPKGGVRLSWEGGETQQWTWAAFPEVDGVRRIREFLPWPSSTGRGSMVLESQDSGAGWASIMAVAAVPLDSPVDAGLRIQRTIEPVKRAASDHWSVGDIYRVALSVRSEEWLSWAVVSDPVPAGASILGSRLGRDSSIFSEASSLAQDAGSAFRPDPDWIEHAADAFQAYFEVLPPGTHTVEYTVRLNVPGEFQLPPTRAEALYQPDVFGSLPRAPMVIQEVQ